MRGATLDPMRRPDSHSQTRPVENEGRAVLAGTPALIPNPPGKDKKTRPSKEKTIDVPDGSGTGAEAAIERDNPPEPGRE